MVSCDKYYIFLAFLLLGTIGIVWMILSESSEPQPCKTYVNLPNDQLDFNNYLKKFNKIYSGEEYVRRLGYFKKSLEEISFLNGNNGTGAKHGLTKFSDLSQAEFAKLAHNPGYGGDCWNRNMGCNTSSNNLFVTRNSPAYFYNIFYPYLVKDAWDWRDRNAVGPVLEQKLCNGCWAFGVVGVMESMEVIQLKRRYRQRSIQELIDCSEFNQGCAGGHVTIALDWLCSKNIGIISQDDYPLKLIQSSCKWRTIDKFQGDSLRVSHFWTICKMNEKDIISKIFHHGPVMAVVNYKPLQHYTGGVIRRACYRSLDDNSYDHIVQIVGYNLSSEIPYYIIRNSWGEDFGENGYVKMAIGSNVCGISDEVTYLDVK